MTDNEMKRRFKEMAKNMAVMIVWPAEESMVRASGNCICDKCGLDYYNHPHKDGLYLICDGMLVKL